MSYTRPEAFLTGLGVRRGMYGVYGGKNDAAATMAVSIVNHRIPSTLDNIDHRPTRSQTTSTAAQTQRLPSCCEVLIDSADGFVNLYSVQYDMTWTEENKMTMMIRMQPLKLGR